MIIFHKTVKTNTFTFVSGYETRVNVHEKRYSYYTAVLKTY